MAFQRPFLISLKRQDSNLRWGFGIKGGKDYGEPLVVHTVGEESLAEKYGLREGDEVIQVGRVNVQDLSLGQVHELMARCGNKIEMFVVREDLLSPRKGKEPQVVRTVVHNPYNSPLSLYSTENIAETLAQQTEVLTEGHVSTEEDEGPESLSFQQKSAVFQLLEEQSKQEGSPTRAATQSVPVRKPKSAPPPPPKPKPPSNEQIFNGYDSHHQAYQDQQKSTSRVEYQTTKKVVSQYQYQQEQPTQYQQQSTVYQTYQKSPGYQSPLRENTQAPVFPSSVNSYQQHQGPQSPTPNYQQYQGTQSPTPNYQQYQGSQSPKPNYQQYQGSQSPTPSYQQSNSNYQQSQGYQSSVNINPQQHSGYQSQATYQPLNQINYQQGSQGRSQGHQTQAQQQTSYQQPRVQQSPTSGSKSEIKVAPAPPPRVASSKQQDNMTAVYKQQYEQHLQKQYEQQQQQLLINAEEEAMKPRAHIIEEDIFDHNCTSGTPITYKAPPAAPPKPHWPPPPPHHERFRSPHQLPDSPPNGMLRNVGSVWPPKKSNAVDLPRTGFNPAAVREQSGSGRRCVWPPPSDEIGSGRNTPQSPVSGRRIQWNPSPSPPSSRRTTYSSPARRKDIQWPPPPTALSNGQHENGVRPSPRMSRKAQFDDYIHEHASINVPQTYRPPPGTQHIEFR